MKATCNRHETPSNPLQTCYEKPVEGMTGGTGTCNATNSDQYQDILADLAASGVKDVYVDGGQTIRRFLAARLLTRSSAPNGETVSRMLGHAPNVAQDLRFLTSIR